MHRIKVMLLGSGFVVATALAGGAAMPALATNPAVTPTELNSDVHLGAAGQKANGNDLVTAAETEQDGTANEDGVKEEHGANNDGALEQEDVDHPAGASQGAPSGDNQKGVTPNGTDDKGAAHDSHGPDPASSN